MDAEIIAVGSEMLTAGRVDTNSLYLTGELNNLGVEVVTKCVIGDDRDRLADAVGRALRRSAIVILSGGLGPTEDDVTREAVAQALDRKLVFHASIAEALERRFAATKRIMAEINKRQAFVIDGAEVLPNDRGTAPGQWISGDGAVAMLLPGPPHELKAMFQQQCLPRLAQLVPKQAIRTAFLRVTGMPESDLDALISPVYRKYQNPVTTILAANGDLQVHLRARCDTEGEAEALLEKLRRGEDFAKLAKKESDGPAGSRNQGGLMETSPGGYGVAAVNKAVESLPIGQLSGVIEGPDGYHIVKVEKRRSAGPASFEEVQDQIKPRLTEAKFIAERAAFIAKLRKNTLITVYNPEPSKRSPARPTLRTEAQSPDLNDKLPPQNP